MAAGGGALPTRLWAQAMRPVVAREPWARIERIAEGVWAVVSTPLEDRTTLCNGGIVAGRAGVLVVESFASEEGARWVLEQAERLAGAPPTHVALTHYHADHAGGLRGVETAETLVLATGVTRDLVRDRGNDPPLDILAGVEVLDGRRPTEVDLGGRSVLVVPRRGHTDSDVSVELSDPSAIFCGDLVWNAMFPNYVDATPSRLSADVRLLRQLGAETYVPGHGPVADAAALDRYVDLLDDVEAAARRAIERGVTAEEAGAAYRIPERLGEWTLFNRGYFARAIGSWIAELGAGGGRGGA
jgi:glyoxylase-like metal-dependent hydrolase (beta-lactamase superfamily II)